MTSRGVHLHTERLFLRPISLDDFQQILTYSQDEEWGQWTPDPKPYTHRFGEKFVAQKVLAPWEKEPRFSVLLDGQVIGGVGLQIDTVNKVGELAYSIARAHWGKGLIPESAKTVIDWGFKDLGLEKIFARTDLRNVSSLRVMEKLGMRKEAHLRQHILVEGVRQDEIHYAILREEWAGTR